MRIETSGIYNDDRFGKALDKLYLADRASLMTEILMQMIRVVGLDLSRVHNDSTTVKAYGKIPGMTKTGLKLGHGKSKDYRPDLKQLVSFWCIFTNVLGYYSTETNYFLFDLNSIFALYYRTDSPRQ